MGIDTLTPSYKAYVVLLSFGIAFLGSYLTITFCELLRLNNGPYSSKLLGRRGLLVAMACSLGGIGIWCMHFVGMSSMTLHRPDGSSVLIRYYLFPTLMSLIVVLCFAGSGIYIASHDVMFGKSKSQIVEIYVTEASKWSIKEIKRTSVSRMLAIISTQSLGYLVCGGAVSGAGISVMHYLGMWGLYFQDGRVVWNAGIITASILIAIIASIAAFWILFRFLSLYPNLEFLRITSAFIMAMAVCGMHYTGMAAAKFQYEPGVQSVVLNQSLRASFSSETAFYGALLAAVLLGMVMVMTSLAELRFWLFNVLYDLRRYTALVEKLRADERHSYAVESFFVKGMDGVRSPKMSNQGGGFAGSYHSGGGGSHNNTFRQPYTGRKSDPHTAAAVVAAGLMIDTAGAPLASNKPVGRSPLPASLTAPRIHPSGSPVPEEMAELEIESVKNLIDESNLRKSSINGGSRSDLMKDSMCSAGTGGIVINAVATTSKWKYDKPMARTVSTSYRENGVVLFTAPEKDKESLGECNV